MTLIGQFIIANELTLANEYNSVNDYNLVIDYRTADHSYPSATSLF